MTKFHITKFEGFYLGLLGRPRGPELSNDEFLAVVDDWKPLNSLEESTVAVGWKAKVEVGEAENVELGDPNELFAAKGVVAPKLEAGRRGWSLRDGLEATN